MRIWQLVRKEIRHRRMNFALAVLSVATAAGVVITAVTILRAHDTVTELDLDRMQTSADKRLAGMEDDYRRYMKELGFNLLIVPAEQDITEFWTSGSVTHTMPEEHVQVLAHSKTTTIRHLLPIIQKRVLWPERQRSIILIGTRGEVPLAHRKPKEPILLAVPPGQAVLGYRLAQDLALEPGQTIALMGREFTIAKTQPERGTGDDATLWIDLATAQELLGMTGRIHVIEALKCLCSEVGAEQLRQEIASILPGTTVIVRQNKVTVRAKARLRARAEHEQAMADEREHRMTLRSNREDFALLLVPAMIIAAMISICLLAFGNVRSRSEEIGILRALGVDSRPILLLFLSRASLIGLFGALLGCSLGLLGGVVTASILEGSLGPAQSLASIPLALIAGLVIASPLLSIAASWAPALIATRQNPAEVLTAP